MIQTGLIQNVHADLVTDASYDYYGLRLATCSLDQRIKVWQLDDNNAWNVEDDWKAHDAAVSKLSWAHPEFGSIIASASFDRTVKIWEQITGQSDPQQQPTVNGPSSSASGNCRWQERAVLTDAKGTVRAVEFVPHHFGLKLATISTDNMLRIYECVDQPSLVSWQLTDELDVLNLALGPSPSYLSRAHTLALATPTQTLATLDGASATLVAAALQQTQTTSSSSSSSHARSGNREADGGWCLSWCKDKYWGEIIAAGCGTSGVIKIIQINARRSTTILTLSPKTNNSTTSTKSKSTTNSPPAPTDTTSTTTTTADPLRPPTSAPSTSTSTSTPAAPGPSSSGALPNATTSISANTNSTSTSTSNPATATGTPTATGTATGTATPPTYAITSVSWAPSCGRSYHLVATGSRDGHVRIWKVVPPSEEFDPDSESGGGGHQQHQHQHQHTGSGADGDDLKFKWTAVSVADFDQHKSAVGRVEWNITGTILSSAGNDGRIRLWKATSGNVWRPAGSVGVEETEEPVPGPVNANANASAQQPSQAQQGVNAGSGLGTGIGTSGVGGGGGSKDVEMDGSNVQI